MEFNRKTGGFFTQSRTYFSGCSARVILVGNRGRNEGTHLVLIEWFAEWELSIPELVAHFPELQLTKCKGTVGIG